MEKKIKLIKTKDALGNTHTDLIMVLEKDISMSREMEILHLVDN